MYQPILIVDDNALMRYCLSAMTASLGIASDCATDGVQALKHLLNNDFACVLMDIEMPVCGGFEATRCIRALDAATGRHTPVIGITAGNYSRQQCETCGMDDLLIKPISREELTTALDKLERKRAECEAAGMLSKVADSGGEIRTGAS